MSRRSLEAEKKRLEKALANVVKLLDESKSRSRVRCDHCGKTTVVSALTYIQTHFYISPYGCTSGDYWKEGEGQFECPKCGRENRLYDRPDVVALKRYFKKTKKVHRKSGY